MRGTTLYFHSLISPTSIPSHSHAVRTLAEEILHCQLHFSSCIRVMRQSGGS